MLPFPHMVTPRSQRKVIETPSVLFLNCKTGARTPQSCWEHISVQHVINTSATVILLAVLTVLLMLGSFIPTIHSFIYHIFPEHLQCAGAILGPGTQQWIKPSPCFLGPYFLLGETDTRKINKQIKSIMSRHDVCREEQCGLEGESTTGATLREDLAQVTFEQRPEVSIPVATRPPVSIFFFHFNHLGNWPRRLSVLSSVSSSLGSCFGCPGMCNYTNSITKR